jgi:hypothetical protein
MNLNTGGWASPLLRLVARLRSDGVNSTTPVTEINGGTISATNADIALVVKGTGALLAQVPDGTVVGGNKRGTNAVDWQMSRTAATAVASGNNSVICGGTNNTTSGAQETFVGSGSGNNVSAPQAFLGGGVSNSCGGTQAFLGGGSGNNAGGSQSVVCGGSSNNADAGQSFVSGGRYGFTRGIAGFHAFPACNVPIALLAGCTQAGLLLQGRQTTDATATVLASNANAVAATNQVTLPNNSAYSFSGEVIAGVTGAGDSARWTINGAIKRGANAASTVMIGTPTVVMTHFDAGASTWVVAVTANTTLGCITVTVTGAAATTIRWVCRINTTEMTY